MPEEFIQIQKWPHDERPTEEKLRALLRAEGLRPYRWSNGPDDVYQTHTHSYHKVIYVVSGSITFGFPVEEDPVTLNAGDRLDLPPGIPHNAVVGPQGVVCLEAHQDA